jgi:hypothetical protein
MSDALKKLYTSELIRRGLGDADYIGPYGITTPPKRKIGEIGQGILSGIEKIGNFTEFLTSPKVGLPKKITDNVVVPAYEYLMSPSEIAKQKAQEKNNSTTKSLPLDELFYSSDNFRDKEKKIAETQGMRFDPVDLTEQIKKLTTPIGVEDGAEAQKIIAEKKAKEAKEAIEEQMTASAEAAGEGALSQEVGAEIEEKGGVDAFGKLFQESMDEFNQNVRGTSQKSQSKTIDDYKKEFAAATGIDVSGKVDKSAALMSLGLALMQNRAGKGFNVGRILSSVGEAGEKALPALEKAKNDAKQAQLAAGKYALDQIKAGESAEAAFAKEVRTNAFNWELKKMELEEKARIEKIKNSGKSNEMKNVAPISIGAGDLKVTVGDVDGVSKFANGPTDAGKIVNAYTKYTEGQENIDVMGDALTAIANQDSSAISILANRAKSLGVAWGIVDGKDMFGEKGISDEAEFEKYRQATINAFKKLILQESQVSNLDLTTLFASFGEVSFMKNPEEARAAIDLMDQYFAAKKRSLEPVINDFGDRDWFRSDKDFERTQTKLELLGKAYKPIAAQDDSGRLKLNISTIPKLKNKEENS